MCLLYIKIIKGGKGLQFLIIPLKYGITNTNTAFLIISKITVLLKNPPKEKKIRGTTL